MHERKKKNLTGTVTGKSGLKSIKVAIDYKVRHPRYGKYIRHRTVLAVHDPSDLTAVGSVVEVAECRPYSKTKSWRLVKVVAEPKGR
jgi:small subunit ribosomal protein S17